MYQATRCGLCRSYFKSDRHEMFDYPNDEGSHYIIRATQK